MLAPNLQPQAIGLNYDLVVPCANETTYFLGGGLCLYFHANIFFKPEVKLLRLLSMLDLLVHQKVCTTTNEMGCETFHSLSCFTLSRGYLEKRH